MRRVMATLTLAVMPMAALPGCDLGCPDHGLCAPMPASTKPSDGPQAASQTNRPITRQLRGLSAEEAIALITRLEDAQNGLKAGEFQPFELLGGSIASYDMTKSSPRDVFLKVPFREVWDIERVQTDNRLWQPYKLAYAPNGLGQLYWDIEVVLGFNGNIERVLMIYKPPAPF